MATVKKLVIRPETGNLGTYYATWEFVGTDKITEVLPNKGDIVRVEAGSKWLNGSTISPFVFECRWYVYSSSPGKVVLNKSPDNPDYAIMSAISYKNVTLEHEYGAQTVTTSTLDYYKIKWWYATSDGVWFVGKDEEVNKSWAQSTYSPPDNAASLWIDVTPVAKTKIVNNKETPYWTGVKQRATYTVACAPPDSLQTPTVEVDGYTLTAKLENISNSRADQVQFQVFNVTTIFTTAFIDIKTARASFKCTMSAGGSYRVRCRAVNLIDGSKVYSTWSDYSEEVKSVPNAPTGFTTVRTTSESSIYLEWSEAKGAETYELEYTTEKRYFDTSTQVSSQTGIEYNKFEVTGLESGDEYFFRVRAVNERGESEWSEISSSVIGSKPSAPTTWSSSTTVITGEPLILYWVHNSEDGSKQTYADLEVTIGGTLYTYTEEFNTDEDEDETTSSFTINTSTYNEGTIIEWRVRTAGATLQYGDWSVVRTVNIYSQPSLELEITDINVDSLGIITSFPFYISGIPGPNTQSPIGYHVAITADQMYTTIDIHGEPKIISAGETIFSKYYDITDSLLVEMSANNIDLENGISYTLSATVSMNSGLTATNTYSFDVAWDEQIYTPDASITIDENGYVAYISPYCLDDDGEFVENVSLSIYRKEYDGRYTEIATGIVNVDNTVITDPHPALNYARYRIIATNTNTGTVGYYDPPAYPVNCKSVIIQWDDEWRPFDSTNPDELADSPWSGSILNLPYNIDVSEKNKIDVAFVEYAGRSHPVSYYGTHIGETATWNVDISKKDTLTLYALRLLQKWMGDVYVREPSGVGYWASVSVSFSQKHKDVKIPVSLNITRVEGGV